MFVLKCGVSGDKVNNIEVRAVTHRITVAQYVLRFRSLSCFSPPSHRIEAAAPCTVVSLPSSLSCFANFFPYLRVFQWGRYGSDATLGFSFDCLFCFRTRATGMCISTCLTSFLLTGTLMPISPVPGPSCRWEMDDACRLKRAC